MSTHEHLLREMLEALRNLPSAGDRRVETPNRLENALKNDFSDVFQHETVKIAAPSKMEVAMQWLREHPEDMPETGRTLAENRQPMGMRISFKTWNDAKKLLKEGD